MLLTAQMLLRREQRLIERRGCTLVGISVTGLVDWTAPQLELPFSRRDALDAALDEVRERYGSSAVIRAVLLGRTQQAPPLLPD